MAFFGDKRRDKREHEGEKREKWERKIERVYSSNTYF